MKYAVCILIFLFVVSGTFVSGYYMGKANKQIEYVEKQVEVIKYVEKKKSEIYTRPNVGRDNLLILMQDGEL